jgi:hypothetical protein
MKLGFVSAILADLPLDEVLAFAAAENFACIEAMGVGLAFQAGVYDPLGFAISNGLWGVVQMESAIAVASSVGGTTDPFALIDPTAGPGSLYQGGSIETDNVNGVAFTNNGRSLYVLSSSSTISRMDMAGTFPPTWTTVLSGIAAGGPSEGNLQYDSKNNLLWFCGNIGPGFEFNAIDVDPQSPTYDTVVYSTAGVGTNLIGTWGLSPSGARICLPDLIGGFIRVWDTDPTSPGFLTNVPLWQPPITAPVVSSLIPSTAPGGLWINNDVLFSDDEDSIFILRQGAGAIPGEIAVYSFSGMGWIDFDSTTTVIDNIGPFSSPTVVFGSAPTSLSSGPATNSLFVCGFGGVGWAGRIDSPTTPGMTSFASVLGIDLSNAWRATTNPNRDRVAIACGASFQLQILDLATLAPVGSIPLTLSGATNVVWH